MAANKPARDEPVNAFFLELLDNYGYGGVSAGEGDELEEVNGLEGVGGLKDVGTAALSTNQDRSVELDGLITSVRL